MDFLFADLELAPSGFTLFGDVLLLHEHLGGDGEDCLALDFYLADELGFGGGSGGGGGGGGLLGLGHLFGL